MLRPFALACFAVVGLLACGTRSATPDASATGGGAQGGGGGQGGQTTAMRQWAEWPMPNQPGGGLPNQQTYTVMTVAGDEVVRDQVTGLTWQRQLNVARVDWKSAMEYCDGLVLAGWDDWRLPSRIELVTLLDLTHTDPAINRPAFPDAHGEWLWTSSRQADDATRSWYVYFYFGYPDTDAQDTSYLARCVR